MHNMGTSLVGLKVSILVVLLEDLCTIQPMECLCHSYIGSVMTSYFQISCGYDTAQYIQNTVYTYVPSVQCEQSLKERIHDPDVLQPCTSSTGSSHHPCNTVELVSHDLCISAPPRSFRAPPVCAPSLGGASRVSHST